MAKGKYGARATNRLASLDNTLLQDKCAEIVDLKGQIAERDQQLRDEKRDRDALIIRRSDERAAELIQQTTKESADRVRTLLANNEKAAILLLNKAFRNQIPDVFIDDVLPMLVPDQRVRSRIINSYLDREVV